MTIDKQMIVTRPSANLTIDGIVKQTEAQRISKEDNMTQHMIIWGTFC